MNTIEFVITDMQLYETMQTVKKSIAKFQKRHPDWVLLSSKRDPNRLAQITLWRMPDADPEV